MFEFFYSIIEFIFTIFGFIGKLIGLKNCSACRNRLQKYYRWKSKGELIRRYEYLNEVNKVMESYIIKRILDGGSQEFLAKSRSDLVNKQNEIKETDNMVAFIKNIK